ncbi:unnamed protein product [Toxocara canis]|uniref:AraC family transcriptional regulator n=1 Tax=Toxocara canis TaxID=6265 RepID=A0A183VFP8_TOXCA|nr:unnamed protein product [Toxocara canis]
MTSAVQSEFHMEEGQTFLLPTDAIYRISDKLDDASDHSSVYSNEPQLAIDDDEQDNENSMGTDEFCRRLLKLVLLLLERQANLIYHAGQCNLEQVRQLWHFLNEYRTMLF